jgi:MFS family permease
MVTQWTAFSLPVAFFPAAAKQTNITESQVGVIFGAFAFGTMSGATVATPLAIEFGPVRIVLWSLLGAAATLAAFGSVPFLLTGSGSATLLTCIRFLNGVASAWVESTIMALTTEQLPDRIGLITGLTEAAIGLGVMLGPIIGSSLYKFGQSLPWQPAQQNTLLIPFLFTAGVELLLFVGCATIMVRLPSVVPMHTDGYTQMDDSVSLVESESAWIVLKRVGLPFWFAASSICLSGALTDSVNPVMYDIVAQSWSADSVSQITALLFLVSGLFYMLLSIPNGIWLDKCGANPPRLHLLLAFGFLQQAIACALLKPPLIPLDWLHANWDGRAAIWAAVLVEATSLCCTIVPGVMLVRRALERTCKDETLVNSMTSSTLTFMYALGATIGPAEGGISNELGGLGTYIWVQLVIAGTAVAMNLVCSCIFAGA